MVEKLQVTLDSGFKIELPMSMDNILELIDGGELVLRKEKLKTLIEIAMKESCNTAFTVGYGLGKAEVEEKLKEL